MYFLSKDLYFPPVDEASYEGVLAVGGDLSIERLLLAYHNGIFPWFNEEEPILWWSPSPRTRPALDPRPDPRRPRRATRSAPATARPPTPRTGRRQLRAVRPSRSDPQRQLLALAPARAGRQHHRPLHPGSWNELSRRHARNHRPVASARSNAQRPLASQRYDASAAHRRKSILTMPTRPVPAHHRKVRPYDASAATEPVGKQKPAPYDRSAGKSQVRRTARRKNFQNAPSRRNPTTRAWLSGHELRPQPGQNPKTPTTALRAKVR